MQHDVLVRSLRKVAATLDSHTDNWFLEGGSCLGFVREGRAIAWDTDVDIGISDPGFDIRKIARRLPVLWFSGFGTMVTGATMWLGVRVDLYRYFVYRDQIAAAIYQVAPPGVKLLLFPKSIIEAGVRRGMFCGVECNVLKQSREYCRTVYGDSYLIPNPNYDYWRDPANAISPGGSTPSAESPDLSKPFCRWNPMGVMAVLGSSNALQPLSQLSKRLRQDRGVPYLVTRALERLLERQHA